MRVHLIVRVPDVLKLTERMNQVVAVHNRQQRGPRLPVAVLA